MTLVTRHKHVPWIQDYGHQKLQKVAMTVKTVGVQQEVCVMTRGHMRPSYVFVAQIHACIYVTTQ